MCSSDLQGDSEDYIEQLVTFFNSDTIDEIKSGKKEELSLGYDLTLDKEEGTWNGVPYNCRQRNIRYNHLSVLKRGRGGQNGRASCRGRVWTSGGVVG